MSTSKIGGKKPSDEQNLESVDRKKKRRTRRKRKRRTASGDNGNSVSETYEPCDNVALRGVDQPSASEAFIRSSRNGDAQGPGRSLEEDPYLTESVEVHTAASTNHDITIDGPQRFPNLVKNPGPNSSSHQGKPDPDLIQFCTWINIWASNDRARKNGPWEIASLDTGAQNSVVFASKLDQLEIPFWRDDKLGTYAGLSSGEVKCIGEAYIKFTIDGRPDACYDAKVDVLEDNPDPNVKPPFNILIGRPVLIKYDLVKHNHEKIPHVLYAKKSSNV